MTRSILNILTTACVSVLVAGKVADVREISNEGDGFGFNYFSRTNGADVQLPTQARFAQSMGWVLAEREDTPAGLCREGLGVEYTEGESTHSKNRPLSVFYDAASGHLSAISVRAWFSDEMFYNPKSWQLPSFGVLPSGGAEHERWVTVTTRDPADVCNAAAAVSPDARAVLGDRLLVNYVHGDGVDVIEIPTLVPPVDGPQWVSGACQLNMSRHWSMPLDADPTQLYGFDHGRNVLPVVPMYSAPQEENTEQQGGITALAFFTTEAQITNKNGGIFDATGTAAQLCSGNFCLEDENKCEYGEGNSVLHVFFANPASPAAQCSYGETAAAGSPGCASVIPYTPM